MVIRVSVKGRLQASRYLKAKQFDILNSMGKSLRDATFHMQNKVKESIAGRSNEPASVDTGRFLNSVDFDILGKDNAVVFSEVPYGGFLEYGNSRFRGRHHFGNTQKRERNKILQIFSNGINSALKKGSSFF